jgi:hypothetical protein
MEAYLGQTVHLDFTTHLLSTGARSNADSTPACDVFEDATDVAILSPTVTLRAAMTGHYRVAVACTVANGFEMYKWYNVRVTATIGAIVVQEIVATIQITNPTGLVVADGGNTASTFKTDLTGADDFWNVAYLVFISGALIGQVREVTDYTGATSFVTFTVPFTATPAASDRFLIVHK